MSRGAAVLATQATAPSIGAVPAPLLQRSCACGGSSGVSGKCGACDLADRLGSSGIQTKLQLGTPGDPYEQEADRIADQVVSLPDAGVRAASLGHGPGSAFVQAQLHPIIQRRETDEGVEGVGVDDVVAKPPDEERILPRRSGQPLVDGINDEFQARLEGERTGGEPLSSGVRNDMETRFGVDLRNVRIHRGARAEELARDIHAEAFTLGNHIYFGSGYFDPASRRGRHLLAHELTHTIQQARGAVSYLKPATPDSPTVSDHQPLVQRSVVEDSFVPPRLPNGDKVHDDILEEFGEANPELFTEVKIPGATAGGESDNAGRADLYMDVNETGKGRGKAATTPAVIMLDHTGEYEPDYLESSRKLLKGGKRWPHKEQGAPRGVNAKEGGCDGKAGVKVCRLDKAPGTILLGDLKPPPSLQKYLEGTIQINSYSAGIASTASKLNAFVHKHPDQADPRNRTWNPKTGTISNLKIPKGRKIRSPTPKTEPLRLYDNRKEDFPIKDFYGHLAVYKSSEDGIWAYEWIPERIPERLRKGAYSDRVVKALTRLNELVRQVRAPPVEQPGAKKQRSGQPPSPAPASGLIQRKETFDKDKWPGEFKEWQASLAEPLLGSSAIGPMGKVGATRESEDVKALRVLDGVKALKTRIPAAEQPADFAQLPNGPKEAAGGLSRLKIWARWGLPIGKLRAVMGGVFVKIASVYENLKERFERARGREADTKGASGGAIGAAIIRGVFKVGVTFFKILVERISAELKRGLKQAATVIVEDLIGEERIAQFEAMKENFEEKIEGIKVRFEGEVEDVREALKPFEAIYETISKVRNLVSDVMSLVDKVKWGLRIIQCVTPPGLGCLKLLIQPIIESLAAQVISTCWFTMNFVKPMLSKFSIFTQLPARISAFIMEQVKKLASLLPISGPVLNKAFAAPAVSTGVTATDLDCDDKHITPAQRAMNDLLDKYGEAKVREIIRILEAAGMTESREMTMTDVKILEGLLDKIEMGEITTDDIETAASNLKGKKASGVPQIDAAIQQLSGLGGGGSGGGQGTGSGSAAGAGPGGTGSGAGGTGTGGSSSGSVTSVPFDQAKTDVPPTGQIIAKTTYRALNVNPEHKPGQDVTIVMGGFINGQKVAEVTDVPATVAEIRDVKIDGKSQLRVMYRIAKTVRFVHNVPGVSVFVADPQKLVPGPAFAAAGKTAVKAAEPAE